jgi:ribosome-binding factor A
VFDPPAGLAKKTFMLSQTRRGRRPKAGPSQRQLRAGELVRHALVDILRLEDFTDPALADVSVTISEVKVSPDLKHAICFVEPLGGTNAPSVVAGLNRASRLLRGKLGHAIDMKFTPALKFVHDDTFDTAASMNRLLDDPRVRRDIEAPGADEAS